jgi:hypothetical protein
MLAVQPSHRLHSVITRGDTESMSNCPFYDCFGRSGQKFSPTCALHDGLLVDGLQCSRGEGGGADGVTQALCSGWGLVIVQDAYTRVSHSRAGESSDFFRGLLFAPLA